MFNVPNLSNILKKKMTYTRMSVLVIIMFSLIYLSIVLISSKNYYDNLSEKSFHQEVRENLEQISKQMKSYENMLNSGIGLFQVSTNVTREDWRHFVDVLDIKNKYPGIQGVGFSVMLRPDEVAAMEKKMRQENYPSFTLKPKGKREQYSSILYLEPLDKRNAQAIGYDMFSQSIRRAAMERARDSGRTSISGKVTLVQEIDSEIQAGMLMYLPLYKKNANLHNVEARRKALIGFVYSAFRMNDLINEIIPDESIIDFEIYDQVDKTEESLMYRSFKVNNFTAKFNSEKTLTVNNHTWYLKFSSKQNFDEYIHTQYPLLISLGLIATYFFLLFVILTLIKSRHLLSIKTSEHRKLSQVVEQSPHAIVITNLKNEIEYVNASFTAITGYTSTEVLGKNPSLLSSGETPTKTFSEMWSLLLKGKSWQGELINKRKDGTLYIESMIASAMVQDNGKISNFVGIKEDITQANELKLKLIKAKEEAENANRAKSEFLANMSHEIRTPLNGVLGLTNLVLKTNLDEKQRDYLEKSKTSSQALLRVINDILDYSKIEAGKLDLEHNTFELDSVMHNIADLFNYQANQKGLQLNINTDTKSSLIGDSLRLTQILTNLIGNAIKFTDEGHIDLNVSLLSEDYYYKRVKFSVKDSGIGMSQETLDNLFIEFNQADTSITRKYGGTGLGLAISKQLVKLMSGDIWVESCENEGSEFIFTVTFEKTTQEKRQENPIKPISSETERLKDSHVLLVEDNKINQIVAMGILDELGIHVDLAHHGKEAIEKIEAGNAYDLILMDLQMPIMDGFEASKQIKKMNETIPIVALSAAVMQEDRVKSSEAQMSAHLTKPIDHDELLMVLLRFIKPQREPKEDIKMEDQKSASDENPAFYGINMEELKGRIGTNPKLIPLLLSTFCDNYKNGDEHIDMSAIGSEAFNNFIHMLKGVSGNISLTKVYELARSIHDTQEISIKKELTPKLMAELKESVKNLSIQLKTLDETPLKRYKKEDTIHHIKEISEDMKLSKAVLPERIKVLEEMLSSYEDKETLDLLKKHISAYKYKDASILLDKIYTKLGQ